MENTVDALTEHEVFVRQLIALYRQKSVLWQTKHPRYRSKTDRAEAFQALVRKAQEFYPEADEDYVRMKIESMRSSFRKERKKVIQSKENCENPDDIYKPNLWYYDLLLFTVGEKVDEEKKSGTNQENRKSLTPFWTRELTGILINSYKMHPCLYDTSHPFYRNKRRRYEAVKKITHKLISTTGKFFQAIDVRRKISLVRGQFSYEYRKIKNSESRGECYRPSLWCFEMLNFLTKEYANPKKTPVTILIRNLRRPNTEDSVETKADSELSIASEDLQTNNNDDIFYTISKNLAHQLKSMSDEQRNIANRIIRDVMYHGQMEQLTKKSKLSLDGK